MQLTNEFRVGVPLDQAWAVLTDVERIAPCMPGAQLEEVAGDEYRGVVKVKVGPITAQYKGAATFVERDQEGGRAVLRAEGRDTRGQGNANATITATLVPDGDATTVSVVTDLTVTGKVAQFGRGVMADVSAKLLTQFVTCLESTVLAGEVGPTDDAPSTASTATAPKATAATATAPQATAATATAPAAPEPAATAPSPAAARRIDSAEAEPIDLLGTAGAPVVKRAVPLLGAILALLLVARWVRRRR